MTRRPSQLEKHRLASSIRSRVDHFTDRAAPLTEASMERWSAALDLRALRAEFGSNLWVVSASQLRRNVRAWTRLTGSPARVCYPVKANPSPAVLEILAELGASAECASAAELQLARLAGFPSERLVYGSPAPELGTAWRVLAQGGTVVADSASMLLALDAKAAEAAESGWTQGRGRVLLRVNPSIDIRHRRDESWTELTAHAARTGKFGVPSECVVELVERLETLRLDGLHAHVGTQMDHVEPFLALARHLAELADRIADATAQRPTILDLGGGLGIAFTAADRIPSIEALGLALASDECDPRFERWFEPGHALVGNAVALLGTITEKKSVRGREWAVADIGTDQLAKITLLSWRHQVLGPDARPLPTTGDGALAGPLCFSGDTLLPATDASRLAVGDIILVQHAGAYCAALASTFNGRRSAGTVVVREDGRVVRTADAARTLDEPLARGHAWGQATARCDGRATPLGIDAVERLSSRVLREELCKERFSYRSALRDGARAFEYEVDVDSPVGFVSMPLAIRIAGDAAIVSVLRMLGHEVKAFPVWGTELGLSMRGQVRTNVPVLVRIELSHATTRGDGASRQSGSRCLAVRFTLRNDDGPTARGSFEIMFDEAAAG